MKKLELSEFAQILKDFEIREGVGTLKDRTLKVEIDQNSKNCNQNSESWNDQNIESLH